MKTLVIHPEDYTTRFLKVIYEDHTDWTVVDKQIPRSKLKDMIKEHDRIVMLGHGTSCGLIGWTGMAITSEFVYLLRDKVLFAVWCNCDEFFKRYGLKGFYTGMIISEMYEAEINNIVTDEIELEKQNWEFAESLKYAIDKPNILESAYNKFNGDSELYKFNKSRMYYEKG
jgi:hypothetical protein